MKTRDYLYYDLAVGLCSTCFRKAEGKILIREGCVYLRKRCPAHGVETVLLADDADYWRRGRELFLKPSEMPLRFQTPVRFGCPFDCGLCSDHEQHACLGLVELTDHCNLECPVCFAASGPSREGFRPLAQVERMLDALVEAEGEPDIVQLSGGEPTLHPEFFAILDAAKARPIRHVMVNTNGVRIASDADFARRLAGYMPGFEVYLQFDSLERAPLVDLRGADLRETRRRALERLNVHGVSTTLVVTVKKGVNDGELGAIVEHALEQPCVRGVTFQPVQDAGRREGFDPALHRLTLTEVRRRLLEQTDVFRPEDVLPVPCHPDCIAMAYALKEGGRVTPLSGRIDPKVLIEGGRNTIAYERDGELHRRLFETFSLGESPESGFERLRELLCCLPHVDAGAGLGYENLFRVIVLQFLDVHSFDVRSVKKACVQVVHPDDGRLIPLDTYNLFYRDELERTRLAALREEIGGRSPDG